MFDENAGPKKARVTRTQPPSNPEDPESDSESALEREANEIAELQTSLTARREKKRQNQTPRGSARFLCLRGSLRFAENER